MRNIIQFSISREDDGYVAQGVNVPVVTQGDTLDDLTANIKEAVELYFEGEDLKALGFGSQPSILTNFELMPELHGAQA